MKRLYFLPWDPLQLDRSLDGGWRTRKNAVKVKLHRAKHHDYSWVPLLHNGLASIMPKEQWLELAVRIDARCQQWRSFLSFEIYAPEGDADLVELESKTRTMRYHPFEGGVKFLLSELLKFRRTLLADSRKLGMLEAENKRLQVVVIFLSQEELADPVVLKALSSLYADSAHARIYPWVQLVPGGSEVTGVSANSDGTAAVPVDDALGVLTAGDFTEAVCSLLTMADVPVIGEGHGVEAFLEARFGYWVRPHSFNREIVAWGMDHRSRVIVPGSNYKFEPTEFYTERMRVRHQEAELYREFLEGLNDGTL